MAKNRYVNTAIWDDQWFSSLDALEQHLFLYFLTNPLTNIHGVYEIPLRRMGFDTGMDTEKLKKIIARFEDDKKVYYERGWVIIKNFVKHQSLNPMTAHAIANHFEGLPGWLKVELTEPGGRLQLEYETMLRAYSVSINRDLHNLTLLKLNLNPNPNSNAQNEHKSYPQTGENRSVAGDKRNLINRRSM
jgi:hypothetical protein